MTGKKRSQKEIEGHTPSKEEIKRIKDIRDKEDSTLFWVLVVIGIVLGSILASYFWVESSKSFEFGGIDWVVENYDNLQIFHGRFVSFTNPNLYYNVFFRTDPRENDVRVVGNLSDFKYGGVISLSKKADGCRGELSRVMLDLSAFLKQGAGIGPIKSGTTNEDIANETGRKFTSCESVRDRTVVIINISSRNSVNSIVQNKDNPYCYTITAKDCSDSGVVEKFMLESVIDFRAAHPIKK